MSERALCFLDVSDGVDLAGLLAVRRSNPDVLARTEVSGGEPGFYDLSMLERDVRIALLDPVRHIFLANSIQSGQTVGYVDMLDAHPEDGVPWGGAVEVHADQQWHGLGLECMTFAKDRALTLLRSSRGGRWG